MTYRTCSSTAQDSEIDINSYVIYSTCADSIESICYQCWDASYYQLFESADTCYQSKASYYLYENMLHNACPGGTLIDGANCDMKYSHKQIILLKDTITRQQTDWTKTFAFTDYDF